MVVVSSNHIYSEVYSIQHYVTMRQVCGFPGTPVSSTNKTDRYDITEILLKVVLNTINQTKPNQAENILIYQSVVFIGITGTFKP